MAYQHEARGVDKAITDAIDTHVEDEKRRDEGDSAGTPVNGTTSARTPERPNAKCSEKCSELALLVGANDGNRTRTVSLES
jgi:hypothetical protein